jgi:hypothetical protein
MIEAMNRDTENFVMTALIGKDGQPGIISKVDMLMDDRKRRDAREKEARGVRWAILVAAITLLFKNFWPVIFK